MVMRMRFDEWNNSLAHFGIKGMRWGVRRFQNPDGTLTPLGLKRYGENGTGTSRYRSNFALRFIGQDRLVGERRSRINQNVADRRKEYLEKKGKDPSKDFRYNRRINRAEKYRNLAKRSENIMNKIMEDQIKKGRTINLADAIISVNTNRRGLERFVHRRETVTLANAMAEVSMFKGRHGNTRRVGYVYTYGMER